MISTRCIRFLRRRYSTLPSEAGWVSTASGTHLRRRSTRDTKPELVLRRALHAAGARFTLHKQLAPRCRPDILLRRHRLAVFVDGDFWHGCPKHGTTTFSGPNAELWHAKLARNQERDREATRLAEELGWIVVRVWECEIHADPVGVAARILARSAAIG